MQDKYERNHKQQVYKKKNELSLFTNPNTDPANVAPLGLGVER